MWTENSYWTNVHGETKKLKDVSDSHLANIIQFVDYWQKKWRFPYYDNLIFVLKQIQKDRGLKDEFINRAQIPYKNPNGKWEIYDFEQEEFTEVEK